MCNDDESAAPATPSQPHQICCQPPGQPLVSQHLLCSTLFLARAVAFFAYITLTFCSTSFHCSLHLSSVRIFFDWPPRFKLPRYLSDRSVVPATTCPSYHQGISITFHNPISPARQTLGWRRGQILATRLTNPDLYHEVQKTCIRPL